MTDSSATPPTGLRRFSALPNVSLLVTAALFALLGFLFFAAALSERRQVTAEYEALVKSQQSAIDSLSDALSACTGDETDDQSAAAQRIRASSRR